MGRCSWLSVRVVPLLSIAVVASACGGGGGSTKKKSPAKPVVKKGKAAKPAPPPETEEDREKKRLAAAQEIVPDGSSCIPPALKEPNGPQLQLAAIDGQAVICAIDTERPRLLGPVGCWQVNLAEGTLGYKAGTPLPGRGFAVSLDDRCARGYCLPKGTKVPGDGVALLAWSFEGSKVAALIGDEVHLYDAESRAHETSFSVRGDKAVPDGAAPKSIHWVGGAIFIEAAGDGPTSSVWVFKADGTAVGPIEPIGGRGDPKPLSTHGGAFSTLDKNRVAVAEQGYSSVTVYDVDTGKRTKLVRKITKGPCKADELDAYWHDQSDKVSARCTAHMTKSFGHLIGADAVAGQKNLLVLLRGARLGELAVLDAKTLTEKKAIKLPWCSGGDAGASSGGGDGDAAPAAANGDDDAMAAPAEKPEKPAPRRRTRGPAKKDPKETKGAEDPDAGGE